MEPKWLYRLEAKEPDHGLWYDSQGNWVWNIGQLPTCKTKNLPMGYDWRYKQNGRDWFSSCSHKEDLTHWYSKEDALNLLAHGFVFTKYLATEYIEYENETVFIKDSCLMREEININDLMQ